jgi:L-seryl-tRNA(Ser) seleniumtransferase
LPIFEIPSFAVRVRSEDADVMAGRLRGAETPVVGRVREGRLWLDVRTLLPGDEEAVIQALRSTVG